MISRLSLLLLVLSLMLFSSHSSIAQSTEIKYSVESKKAITLYQDAIKLIDFNRQFDQGMFYLNKAISYEPNFVEAHNKLAATYKVFNQMDKVKEHYLKVAELAPNDPRYLTAYAELGEIYLKEGNFEESKKYLEIIMKHPYASDKIYKNATKSLETVNFAIENIDKGISINPRLLTKSTQNVYAYHSHPVLTADQRKMIYCVRGHRITDDENIVVSEKQDTGWSVPVSISKAINTGLNEGFASISGDGSVLVFTACDRKDSYGGCDLYISYKKGDLWSFPENLGKSVNSTNWDSQPSISADGRKVYFSSDRKEGKGGKDIWYTELTYEGEWTDAVNLGEIINTSADEVTPFVHADGKNLYFASNGHKGFGGFDLFKSSQLNNTWDYPANLGYPINTFDNEGSMYITPDYKKGYYEKYVKDGMKARADIYEFDVPASLQENYKSFYVIGTVYDAFNKTRVVADLELVDLRTNKIVQHVVSDSTNGHYLLVLTQGAEYSLHVRKEGFLFCSVHMDFIHHQKTEPFKMDVFLQPIRSKESVVMRNIFFQKASFELDPKSFYELDKIVDIFLNNPTLKVEISGHTDNVGKESENITLSLNRALSVKKYLEKKGITSSRIQVKGYGASKPVSDNKTEEGKQQNRRIEFMIL